MTDTDQPAKNNPDAACERCGRFETLEIAGKILCPDCVALAGCACAGSDNSD